MTEPARKIEPDPDPWGYHVFTLVIPPRGQARARSTVLMDKDTNQPRRDPKTGRVIIIHHKEDKHELDEQKLEALMFQYRPAVPFKGPILLGVRAYFAVPQSKPKKFQAAALAGEIRPEVKPDLDNIVKHVKDVGTGIFWGDDKQIVGYIAATGKYYGDPARYEIVIGYRKDMQA